MRPAMRRQVTFLDTIQHPPYSCGVSPKIANRLMEKWSAEELSPFPGSLIPVYRESDINYSPFLARKGSRGMVVPDLSGFSTLLVAHSAR